MRRLNVGCGPKHIKKGWYNLDIQPFPGIDEARDATLPLDDLSPLSYVYSEHFLEHLSLDGAIRFLRNSARALVPGGRIRLSTPALKWVLATHFDLQDTKDESVAAATLVINRAFQPHLPHRAFGLPKASAEDRSSSSRNFLLGARTSLVSTLEMSTRILSVSQGIRGATRAIAIRERETRLSLAACRT